MKKILLLLVAVLLVGTSFSQITNDQRNNCDFELIKREYAVAFSNFEDQTNFSKLTDFIKRRDSELKDFVTKTGSGKILISSSSLKSIVEELTSAKINTNGNLSSSESNLARLDSLIKEINDIKKSINHFKDSISKIKTKPEQQDSVAVKKKLDDKYLKKDNLERQITQFPFDKISINKELAEKVIPLCIGEKIPGPFQQDGKFYIYLSSLDYIIGDLKKNKEKGIKTCDEIARKSIENMQADIDEASRQLQKITSQEALNQDFKKYITLTVAILLGLILVAFFGGVLYKSGNDVKAKLIGESGLQFITIFVIIIAVILFGVMGILQGSELAAILSAIAGYILGKTAPPKSDKTLEMELEALRLEEKKADRQREERQRLEEQEKIRKEEARLAKEATDKAEAERVAAEQARIAEEQRIAEEARLAEEAILAEEARIAQEQIATNEAATDDNLNEGKSEEDANSEESKG